eukprot:3200348-Rhodomonas_salina.2
MRKGGCFMLFLKKRTSHLASHLVQFEMMFTHHSESEVSMSSCRGLLKDVGPRRTKKFALSLTNTESKFKKIFVQEEPTHASKWLRDGTEGNRGKKRVKHRLWCTSCGHKM